MSILQATQRPDDEVLESISDEPTHEKLSYEDNKVINYLDLAVQAAEDKNMPTSELIGMFFFYAHNLAQEARDIALGKQQS